MNFKKFNFVTLVFVLLSFTIVKSEDINGKGFELKEDLAIYFPDLNKIVEGIEQDSPRLKISKQLVREAEANKKIADSIKGVKINLNLGSQSIYENRPGQSYYQTYRTVGSVFLKKPIFHWGAINAKTRIAELSKKYVEQQSAISKLNLIIEIRSEYGDLVLLNYQLNLEKKILQLAQQNEENLIKRKNLGLNTELDVSTSTIQKLEQAIKIAETKRLLEKKISFFKFETGYINNFDLSIPSIFLEICYNHNFGEKIPIIIGTQTSEDIEQLKTLIDSESEKVIIAESAMKPKVNLIGGFYQDQIDLPDNPNSIGRNNFLIGVEANWALWDSSLSKGEKSLALAQKRKFEIQLQSGIQKLRLEIESLRSELFNLADQISLSRKLVQSAKQSLEINEIKFNQNQITPNDLLETKINLSKKELGLIESVFKYFQVQDQYRTHLNSSNL